MSGDVDSVSNSNSGLNARVTAILGDLPGLESRHIDEGLSIASAICLDSDSGAVTLGNEAGFIPFCAELAWLFWLDDQFDEGVFNSGEQPDDQTLGYSLILSILRPLNRPSAEIEFFKASCQEMFEAFATCTRSEPPSLTFEEYLPLGVKSVALFNTLASGSVFLELGFSERAASPAWRELVWNASAYMRLQNDLASESKERQRGEWANAVLLVERTRSVHEARAFVQTEAAQYLTTVERALSQMDNTDPLAQLLKRLIEYLNARFYVSDRERYVAVDSP